VKLKGFTHFLHCLIQTVGNVGQNCEIFSHIVDQLGAGFVKHVIHDRFIFIRIELVNIWVQFHLAVERKQRFALRQNQNFHVCMKLLLMILEIVALNNENVCYDLSWGFGNYFFLANIL
jgi:hypothetical protein